jgi:hypothetical protein
MTLRAFYEAENTVWVNSSTDSTLIALPRASYSRVAYMCSVSNFQPVGVQFRPFHLSKVGAINPVRSPSVECLGLK